MVSVCVRRNNFDLIPIANWGNEHRSLALVNAKVALFKVGIEKTDFVEEGEIALTIRRLCKDSERKLVIEEYLN